MLSIGLTGNVASGKSSVAHLWAQAGVPVVDADSLARVAVAPGTPGLASVLGEFGAGMLGADGELDRTKMRALVFRDPGARHKLESLLHPRIAQLRGEWIEDRRLEGAPLVVSEVPLLFEAGMAGEFDRIVFVDAPEDERLRRLVEDRGIAPDEAHRMIGAQEGPEKKRIQADHVIQNDGSREELEKAAHALLADFRALSLEADAAANAESAPAPEVEMDRDA